MTILGICAVGIFTVFQYVQSTKVNIITTANLTNDIDNANKFIRTKLSDSETAKIESINSGDKACLALTRTEKADLSGIYLSDGSTYIHDADFSAISGSDDRTISVWFRASSKQVGRHWLFGSGRSNQIGQQFAVFIDDGKARLDFKNSGFSLKDTSNNELDVRDDSWYHLAIVVDAPTANSNIEDVSFTVHLNRADAGDFNTTTTTLHGYHLSNHDEPLNTVSGHEGFVAGARTKTGLEPFTGAIFDLRIWDKALTTAQIEDVFDARQNDPQTQSDNLILNWRFERSSTDTINVPDDSGSGHAGTIKRRDGSTPDLANLPFSTTVETIKAQALALYDLDADSRYELWSGENIAIDADTAICPADPSGINGWTQATKDIFTKGDSGFFSTVNADAKQTLFSYGYGEDQLQVAAGKTANTTKLSMSRDFKSDALCRHGHPVSFDTTGCSSDNFDRAYVWIVENFDNQSEQLVILGGTPTADGARTVYSDIPFAPSTMRASWDPRTGVMAFTNTDDSTAAASVWSNAMESVGYQPSGVNYFSTKTLKFSLGYLSFEVTDNDHLYHYVDTASSYTSADSAAKSSGNALCGMQGYLATVTSALEQEFLATRFIQDDDSWPAGWLGGRTSGSDWVWQSPSPETNQRFWIGNGQTGKPVQDNASDSGKTPSGNGVETGKAWASKRNDLDTSTSGDLMYRQATAAAYVDIRYTQFSGGTDSDTTSRCLNVAGLCEPHNGDYLTMTTGPMGHGLWSAVGNTKSCDSSLDKVCGSFEEWTDNVSARLVDEVVLDIKKYRVVCEAG